MLEREGRGGKRERERERVCIDRLSAPNTVGQASSRDEIEISCTKLYQA